VPIKSGDLACFTRSGRQRRKLGSVARIRLRNAENERREVRGDRLSGGTLHEFCEARNAWHDENLVTLHQILPISATKGGEGNGEEILIGDEDEVLGAR
jgi:hypothetical protein